MEHGAATVLHIGPADARDALAQAFVLRSGNTPFLVVIDLPDMRVRALREHSRSVCTTFATWDEVRIALDDAPSPGEPPPLDRGIVATLRECIRLSDGLGVASWAQFYRLQAALGPIPRIPFVLAAPVVPMVSERTRGDALVVFAGDAPADELGAYIVALRDVPAPLIVVAAEPASISGVSVIVPSQAPAALAHARVIIDATGVPDTAAWLASFGRPLAIESASGAGERTTAAATFDEGNRRSILAAVSDALGHAPVEPGRPVVSVIVPTYDRAYFLTRALGSIAAQTYDAIETIVVNDCGPAVDAVVARAGVRDVRIVTTERNGGPAAARNRGLAAATGTYVTFLDDDDAFFPDHLARMVDAIERAGTDVAYGQMINVMMVPSGGGRYLMDGLLGHDTVLDHAEVQWGSALATPAILIRRSVTNAIGGFDETLPSSEDLDFWMRLAHMRLWARVPAITTRYNVRSDGSNISATRSTREFEAYTTMYAAYPSTRPLVVAGRSAMLELFAARRVSAPPPSQ